ncbi:MAG: hypothetical protein P4L77_10700 [Sulfuriferula sp.]|nr:hypothetical protein [Sulfuriferula sp.]
MPKYLSEVPSDVSRRMITMEVHKTSSIYSNGMSVEVCLMDADRYAREFSQLVADTGGRVRLIQDARIRAIYEKGERTRETDMRDFYDMSGEEYAEGRILCSKSHEYF